ncbi:MAG: TlpA disulfide reductase family protein [Gemmatimonadaceae bacterium]
MTAGYRFLAALGMTLAAAFAAPLSAQEIGLELGTVGPGAKVETLDRQPADLAQYVGKQPVLMEFWATWCGNCHELEPTMKAMHKKYGSRVAFLGVAVSVNQSSERVKAYVAKNHLPWIQFFDRKGEATGAYDVPATSYVVVLDKAGKVVYTGVGGKQDLESAIRKALGE